VGYRTAWFGKWHCGEKSVAKDCGFEGFSLPGYGFSYIAGEYRDYLESKKLERPRVKIEWSARLLPVENKVFTIGNKESNLWGPFETTGHMLTQKEGHVSYFLSSIAIDWLESLKPRESFLLKLELWSPHHPYHVAEPFYNSVDSNSIQLPLSFVQDLDMDMPDTFRSSVRR